MRFVALQALCLVMVTPAPTWAVTRALALLSLPHAPWVALLCRAPRTACLQKGAALQARQSSHSAGLLLERMMRLRS